jgi:hypothetical protein
LPSSLRLEALLQASISLIDWLINEKVEAEQAKLARDYGARWGDEPKGL